MGAPCPFCGFEASDFRPSHNWQCSQCGKDYAGWLIAQKSYKGAENPAKADKPKKQTPLFSKQKIPSEAEPVKFAQFLFVFAILLLLGLNFVVEGLFSWVYPVSIPFAGYYAFTMHKTGFAVGQHAVYCRGKNPIGYRLHLWGVIAYIMLAFGAWLG